MTHTPDEILSSLDRCCEDFTFPMLDNGYWYLAATRMSLFRSKADWAMVIEVFGFSPRVGLPDVGVHTYASRLHNRNRPDDYVTREAYENYLARKPHDELRSFGPVAEGSWQDAERLSLVAEGATSVPLRGRKVPLPPLGEYARHGIKLEDPPRVRVFELCRYLAAAARDAVLATPKERRVSVLPGMGQILQLEEWRHPNVADDGRASRSKTFRQLAEVLATGDVRRYTPSPRPNTHWRHWPMGGTL
jgi:hypothetical protein